MLSIKSNIDIQKIKRTIKRIVLLRPDLEEGLSVVKRTNSAIIMGLSSTVNTNRYNTGNIFEELHQLLVKEKREKRDYPQKAKTNKRKKFTKK